MSNKIVRVGELFDPSFENLEPKQIKETLRGVAYEVETGTYTRQLSKEELAESRERFADLTIDVADINREIKDFTDLKKVDIKAKSKEMGTLIGDIKTKTTTVTGTVFQVDDQENRLMYIYDENGVCVDVRALKSSEKQRKIFSITDKSTGTDGQ